MYLYLVEIYTDTEHWKQEEFDKDKFLIVAKSDEEANEKAKNECQERQFDFYEIEKVEVVDGFRIEVESNT